MPSTHKKGTVKTGAITSFFKPVARNDSQQTSQSSPPAQKTKLLPLSSSPGSLPPPPSSINSTPAKPKGLSRDHVFAASDDENDDDGSSSDGLEDLMSKFDTSGNPLPSMKTSSRNQNPWETPRSKRIATDDFLASPLTINTRHKFDMAALAKDAAQDEATRASSRRLKDMEEAAERLAAEAEEEDARMLGEASADAIVGMVQANGGNNAQKVLRAVQRGATTGSHDRYCFFVTDYKVPVSTPAPKKTRNGPWELLSKGSISVREQYLVSGVPYTIFRKTGGLPDEVFEWILDELCVQQSILMQQEYCNLASTSQGQVKRLVTPERLHDLLLRLGATAELTIRDSKLNISRVSEDPYDQRDWSNVKSFMQLLALISHDLSAPSVTYVAQALLRMSLDQFLIYNVDILAEYECTISHLLDAVPRDSWNDFCRETSLLLSTAIKKQSIRMNALSCLPISKSNSHDLRKRLATSFLFDDPALAAEHPNNTCNLQHIIARVAGQDFAVNPRTDFDELRAMVLLLDIVIDDGSFAHTGDLEDEKRFNAQVDELAAKLREMWRKINDAGMKLARTETKNVIEWVQKRLSHSVRTRRQVKKSIFDLGLKADDVSLPQQQNYMKDFLSKRLAATPNNDR